MKHKIIIEEQQFGLQGGYGSDSRSFHLSLQISKMEGVTHNKYPFFAPQTPFEGAPLSMPGMPPPSSLAPEELQATAGDVGHKLAEQILALEGVVRVNLFPFRAEVEKGTCFDWDELSPKIKEILLTLYREQGIEKVGLEVRKLEDWNETPQGRATLAHNALLERFIKLAENEQRGDRGDDWRQNDDEDES